MSRRQSHIYQEVNLRVSNQELFMHGTLSPLCFCIVLVTGGGTVVIMAISPPVYVRYRRPDYYNLKMDTD